MDISLQQNEILSFGLKRIALLQIENSLRSLEGSDENYDETVHSVRKNFKKMRAVLRLVRYKLGDDFKNENYFYRDLGRKLSELRDSVVLIETLDKISTESSEDFITIRNKLEENHRKLLEGKLKGLNEFESVKSMLIQAKGRIYDWNFHGESFDIIYEGLLNIYKKGKYRMYLAFEHPTPENYHEWRKKVKYLWYAVRILSGSWPNYLNSLADSLKHLSDLLGDAHDLDELKQTVVLHSDSFSDEGKTNILIEKIDRKVKELTHLSRFPGERIYMEDAPEFTNRMRSYYDTWMSEKISPQKK